jgi:hypothetical protein
LKSVAVNKQSFSVMADKAFDVNRGLNLMYVYCDVASHAIVGDTKTPLLRVCNVAGKHGEFVRLVYAQPHYVLVGRREFDSIEIGINNELGKPMPFQSGKSVSFCIFAEEYDRSLLSHPFVERGRAIRDQIAGMNSSRRRLRSRSFGTGLPHTWYNVDNRDGKYWIGAFDIAVNRLVKTLIKSGYYKSGDEFAYSLTHQATRTFADVPEVSAKFTFVKRTNRIRMQIRNSNERVVVLSW